MTVFSASPDRPATVFRPEPGLRGVLADNPSAMTQRGTISWIVGEGRVALIDPGPADPAHLRALLAALDPGERIGCILVTHAHLDHCGLSRPLAEATGAPVLAYGTARAGRSAVMMALFDEAGAVGSEGTDVRFVPDETLADTASVSGVDWELRAIHTPGHFGNHLCFAWGDRVFSGDHVMGWSSSIVAPPDGDMGDYMASLDRLRREVPGRLYPAHGDPVTDPIARIDDLARHRRLREAQILVALAEGPLDARSIAARLYPDLPRRLLGAAEMNVLAHLIDLNTRNAVEFDGRVTLSSPVSLSAGGGKFVAQSSGRP